MSNPGLRSCGSLAVGNEALLRVKAEPSEEREKMDAKKKDGIRASWFWGTVQSVYKIIMQSKIYLIV
jgi:hypothetical protein